MAVVFFKLWVYLSRDFPTFDNLIDTIYLLSAAFSPFYGIVVG